MDPTLLLKLLLVHLTGDYLLQFGILAEGKQRFGFRSWHVWAHIAIHGIVVHLVLQTWWITLVTLVSHAAIDVWKLTLRDSPWQRTWFFVDQAAHLSVVAFIAWWGANEVYPLLPEWFEVNLVLITGAVLVTKPSKYMIGMYMTGWIPPSGRKDLPFCGRGPIIGVGERLAVLGLILTGWAWVAAVLLALKISVHLFGPWRQPERVARSYDVVGSLLSFAFAGLTAWGVIWMQGML